MSYTRTRRSDTGSQRLIQVARQLGLTYIPSDGTIDGVLWSPHTGLVLVDWKTGPKARKTAKQQALDRAGVPISSRVKVSEYRYQP